MGEDFTYGDCDLVFVINHDELINSSGLEFRDTFFDEKYKDRIKIESEESGQFDFPVYEVPGVKNVIFNPPATIVFWEDGTKTVVKDETWKPTKKLGKRWYELGFLNAVAKNLFGSDYWDTMNKFAWK